MPEWLKDAVFYEIYPQSFYDSNGDGIGDLQGIIHKLDYIKDLGCNALWINPCFDSPFMDAGYDVRDYKKVAPRYGTNEDLIQLFKEAHQKGIHVLLDLVPGHTSDTHPWFRESCKAEPNEYSGRYIWTSHVFEGIEGRPYIAGMADRNGCYMLNFFASQPALNYGWLNRTRPWMSSVDSPEALATRDAMLDIMRFWLDQGCDGFRVDMADSLVKNDDERKSATSRIWQEARKMLDKEYPEAVFVSEWSNPELAVAQAGFHMDFLLDHAGHGYNSLFRDYETEGEDHSYFKGNGDIQRFLGEYLYQYNKTKEKGYISLITGNHDTPRIARTLTVRQLKLGYALILTMPGVPFIYYGDEIGMRYLDIPTKEGGYARTGSRTPMQWDNTKNMGFSEADAEQLYLPQDLSDDAPTVQKQAHIPDSLYQVTKQLTSLRHKYTDLQADGSFEVLHAESGQDPFVYRRGSLILAVNPSCETVKYTNEVLRNKQILYRIGEVSLQEDTLTAGPESFAVFG